MHSNRMHSARLLTTSRNILCILGGGEGSTEVPPPVGRPGGMSAHPPGCRPPLDSDPLEAEPPGLVTWDACWEATPFVNGMIHRCKNITLPQTSYAGGNKKAFQITRMPTNRLSDST